jgi:hypothetical protein
LFVINFSVSSLLLPLPLSDDDDGGFDEKRAVLCALGDGVFNAVVDAINNVHLPVAERTTGGRENASTLLLTVFNNNATVTNQQNAAAQR